MSIYSLLFIYSVVIISVSLLGGWLPSRVRMTHTGTQTMMSFVAGLMLGIAFYQLLPHAILTLPDEDRVEEAMWWLMLGLLFMFVLLRAFHFHQHGPVEESALIDELIPPVVNQEHNHAIEHSHDHGHSHTHKHTHGHNDQDSAIANPLSWAGIAFGLALHTIIDGVALGAAIQAGVLEAAPLGLLGFGVFVAIVLHKPLDSMSIASLMMAGGWSVKSRSWVNILFSLMCPLGALLFFVGVEWIDISRDWLVGVALAFSAGVFLCISLSDLLPEVQFHSHDRARLTIALLAGIAVAYSIGLLEPGHEHDHGDDHGHAHSYHQTLEDGSVPLAHPQH